MDDRRSRVDGSAAKPGEARHSCSRSSVRNSAAADTSLMPSSPAGSRWARCSPRTASDLPTSYPADGRVPLPAPCVLPRDHRLPNPEGQSVRMHVSRSAVRSLSGSYVTAIKLPMTRDPRTVKSSPDAGLSRSWIREGRGGPPSRRCGLANTGDLGEANIGRPCEERGGAGGAGFRSWPVPGCGR